MSEDSSKTPDRSAWTPRTYLRYHAKKSLALWEHYALPSRHFAYSIMFVLPLLVIYGVGLAQGLDANFGQSMLEYIPNLLKIFIGPFLVNVLVAIGLVAGLIYLVRQFIKNPVKISVYSGLILCCMLVETALVGMAVEIIREISMRMSWPSLFTFRPNPAVMEAIQINGLLSPWKIVHASIGAGIFEELVYRVIFIRLLYFAAEGNDQPFGTERTALNKAVLLSSVLFAFMHLGYFSADNIRELVIGMTSYVFIGVLFAIVYLRRGYAIAAGSHAFVDIYMFFGVI
ncbi:MAG TPA: CPBP family intramembrane glutamic endopeptidase [Pirellulales bacterium]|nr:CPBP family intramembrane glutamic endopeptidase [Pirellulales bacterium]